MTRTRRTGLGASLLAVAVAAALAGCGDAGTPSATAPSTASTPTAAKRPAARPPRRARVPRPPAPRCTAGAANCTAASGDVLALESVDPDGDGDLHLILLSDESVTLPGVTVLDVSRALRPARDPQVGDWAAGAGPVYTGSHGQHQIQVERVVYAPKR
jgi:hypothetical protein